MISDEKIDQVLLSHITHRWQKVAKIVASAMFDTEDEAPDLNDTYFAQRVIFLAEKGLIESRGDLTQIGFSEVRLADKENA